MIPTPSPRSKFELAHQDFLFEQWPFYNMSRLIALYHRRIDKTLKPIGLDAPRWRILSILSKRKTASVTQIAEDSTALLSTTAKTIQRMVSQGMLQTANCQRDGRAIEVSLTETGRSAFAAAQPRVAAIANRAFTGVSEQEMGALNDLTRRIHFNLDV